MLPKWCCVLLRASYLEAYKVHQLVKMLSGFPTDARIFSYFNNGKLNLIKNYMSCSHLYKQHSSHPNKSYWIWDIEWNFKASRCREETEVRRGKVTCPMLVSKARVYSVSDRSVHVKTLSMSKLEMAKLFYHWNGLPYSLVISTNSPLTAGCLQLGASKRMR